MLIEMKFLAISCILFAVSSAGRRSSRKVTSKPDEDSSPSAFSLGCGIPTQYESLPSGRKKNADGNLKVKMRKKIAAPSAYPPPPPFTLESPLKIPIKKSVKFGRVSIRGPRNTDSVEDIPPPPPRLGIFSPVLVRQQKSYRRLAIKATEERFEERERLATPGSNIPPSPPIRQKSARRVASGRVEAYPIQPFVPSPPRSKIPPSPPIRQESAHRAPEGLWNGDERGFVSKRVEAYSNPPFARSPPTPPRSNIPPSPPIRQESDHGVPDELWEDDDIGFVSE
jgi:hypothetical protein